MQCLHHLIFTLFHDHTGANIELKDTLGNTPLGYSVIGGHEACSLMLIQKGANINVSVMKDLNTNTTLSEKNGPIFKFLPRHFENKTRSLVPLFQELVRRDWVGVTFVAMGEMEKCGMTYASAIEVAFHLHKFQFASRLIQKQVSPIKLRQLVTAKRNLINSLAYECFDNDDVEENILKDIIDHLLDSGVNVMDSDDFGCSPFHYACLNHRFDLLKILLKKIPDEDKETVFMKKDNFDRSPFLTLFWRCNGMKKSGNNANLYSIVDYLLSHCSNIDTNSSAVMKCLSHLDENYAAEHSHMEYTQVPPNDQLLTYSPLIIAIVHGERKLVELLLDKGSADIDYSDSHGKYQTVD